MENKYIARTFAEEISKVDSGFYLRMKESKYYPEDKKDSSGKCPELPYALFVDKDYTDKDYHKEYPTIYHLRKNVNGNRESTRYPASVFGNTSYDEAQRSFFYCLVILIKLQNLRIHFCSLRKI